MFGDVLAKTQSSQMKPHIHIQLPDTLHTITSTSMGTEYYYISAKSTTNPKLAQNSVGVK